MTTLNASLSHASSPEASGNPHQFLGLAPLMRQSLAGIDLKPLGTQLIAHLATHADDANALLDLSIVLQLIGNRELALATQMEALQLQQIYRLPATGNTTLRVLAMVAPGDLMANTPLEFLLEDSSISLDLMYIGKGVPPIDDVPEHDVLFVAIGESDANRPLLQELENITREWPRPVLNHPERITRLARDRACDLLQKDPTIVMPVSVRIDRDTLQEIAQGKLVIDALIENVIYPVIVRPVGSHAGKDLQKIASAEEIVSYLHTVSAAEFYVARFVDYRSRDGLFRKYRIMLIEGQPFISHMAISTHWMIHYLNAGMAENADKRAEEARFMDAFDTDFAVRHQGAFSTISEQIGLDYVGIDCGETRDGKLLIFEVDSDMIVHAMDPVDLFPYKPARMHKLFDAFRAMLGKAVQNIPA